MAAAVTMDLVVVADVVDSRVGRQERQRQQQ
jgi:hypothetical protein